MGKIKGYNVLLVAGMISVPLAILFVGLNGAMGMKVTLFDYASNSLVGLIFFGLIYLLTLTRNNKLIVFNLIKEGD